MNISPQPPLFRSAPRAHGLSAAIRVALLAAACAGSAASADPGLLPLSSLDGRAGFKLDAPGPNHRTGVGISNAGDINGDGLDDLLIGAYAAHRAYVVFGRRDGFPSPVPLAQLDGSNGFTLTGADDVEGYRVSALGDVNGDGLDDLVVAAPGANQVAGRCYVVFGRSGGFSSTLDLTSLDGTAGFVVEGRTANYFLGSAVGGVGDFNGDGFDDVILGESRADGDVGGAFLLYGRTSFPSPLLVSALASIDGFRLQGEASGDFAGMTADFVGDLNDDGFDDIFIGAANANGSAGRGYVVYGRAAPVVSPLALSTLNGSEGFVVDGQAGEGLGYAAAAAGDVNGDGVDDLLLGGFGGTASGQGGRTYVIFGTSSGPASPVQVANLNGGNGFVLNGEAAGDRSGRFVDGGDDINGDGVDDIILSASESSLGGPVRTGRSYVFYGRRSSYPPALDLADLNGVNGFKLDGELAGDRSGRMISRAGDVNGDGLGDVLIGAFLASPNGQPFAGRAYAVFGARDRIFRDGGENDNLDEFYPRLDVRAGFIGSAVSWRNGATCNCDDPPFNFNIYRAGAEMAFFWPSGGIDGGVASGGSYAVLQPGAVVSANSSFITDPNAAATAGWRTGTSGYLGFRFGNPNTGLINYGYALIETSGPNGFPARVVRIGVNLTGLPVTIPVP